MAKASSSSRLIHQMEKRDKLLHETHAHCSRAQVQGSLDSKTKSFALHSNAFISVQEIGLWKEAISWKKRTSII